MLAEELEQVRALQQAQEKDALALDHEERKLAEELARPVTVAELSNFRSEPEVTKADLQKLKTELDALRVELANAQRKGEYQKAGELAYGRIPELEKKLKDTEGKGGGAVVEEAVTSDHIAQVVSRWTGVPVDRMLEGEKEKLLQMESKIGDRVVGHLLERIVAERFVAAACATVVESDHPVLQREYVSLHVPQVLVGAETLNHQHRRRALPAEHLVVQAHSVGGACVGHVSPRPIGR